MITRREARAPGRGDQPVETVRQRPQGLRHRVDAVRDDLDGRHHEAPALEERGDPGSGSFLRSPVETESETVTTLASCTGPRYRSAGPIHPGASHAGAPVAQWVDGHRAPTGRGADERPSGGGTDGLTVVGAGLSHHYAGPSGDVPVLIDASFTVPRDGYAARARTLRCGQDHAPLPHRWARTGPDRDVGGRGEATWRPSRATSSPPTAAPPWGSGASSDTGLGIKVS